MEITLLRLTSAVRSVVAERLKKLDTVPKSVSEIKENNLQIFRFDFKSAKNRVMEFLTNLMQFDEQDKEFVEQFNSGKYRPELLFPKEVILRRILVHPMALWKIAHK